MAIRSVAEIAKNASGHRDVPQTSFGKSRERLLATLVRHINASRPSLCPVVVHTRAKHTSLSRFLNWINQFHGRRADRLRRTPVAECQRLAW